MFKIYLITTQGCHACDIQKNILNDISKDYNFDLQVCDFKNIPAFLLHKVQLKDFPITILIADNKIKGEFAGTLNKKKVIKIIEDINF